MPSKYGTGPYGQGKFSAATAFSTVCAQGSYTFSGKAALFPLAGKLTAVQGSYTLSGQAVGLGGISWAVSAGYYTLSGQAAQFTEGSIWTPETPASDAWTPQTPSTATWTPVPAGSTIWVPN